MTAEVYTASGKPSKGAPERPKNFRSLELSGLLLRPVGFYRERVIQAGKGTSKQPGM
jgi:hypothetical protein